MDQIIKIIALNGSPHKNGNTATLMSWIIEGMRKNNTVEVNWIHVRDLNISYCQGCLQCLKTGRCVIDDDLQQLLSQIEGAHGIIVGSPVYEGFPTAQIHTIMDRIALLKLYTGILEDNVSVGVATSGIAPTKKVAKDIAYLFGSKLGTIGCKTASLKHGYRSLKDHPKKRIKKKARKLGQKLVKTCEKGDIPGGIMRSWINFLRKNLLSKIVTKQPDIFGGVLDIWKEKGWV